MRRAMLFLYAESPVHAGADTSLGAVDLPIQREAATDLPVIWGQSLKGALRSHARPVWGLRQTAKVFGDPPPGSDEEDEAKRANTPASDAADPGSHGAQPGPPGTKPGPPGTKPESGSTSGKSAGGGNAAARGDGGGRERNGPPVPGSLSVGDAQLVAFPVPTVRETFAWTTSPLALARLARKAGLAGVATLPAATPTVTVGSPVLAAAEAWCTRGIIGPYVTTPTHDAATGEWARWLAENALPATAVPDFFTRKLRTDLLTVPDGVLRGISVECAELSPRIQLETGQKTVKHGPFYSEYLPTETLLAALLECSDDQHLADLQELLDGKVLRLGGNETIGKGLLWCRFGGGRP